MSGSRLRRYLSEALRLLRQRRLSTLRDKSRRMADAMTPRIAMRELEAACEGQSPLVCVVDGAQGGGAAMAAARSGADWRAQGVSTLHIGCDPMGRITVKVMLPGETAPALSGRLDEWPVLPAAVSAMEIHSLAGFTEPHAVAAWLTEAMALIQDKGDQAQGKDDQAQGKDDQAQDDGDQAQDKGDQDGGVLQDKPGSREVEQSAGIPPAVTVHWHDHYLMCPTRHLLNSESRYCDLPDPSVCASCLPKNAHCLDAPLRSTDILAWREQWGQVLAGASSIRVFSPSSRELLRRIWPEVNSKVVLAPHDTAHIPQRELSPSPETPLHIGVVGRIAAHKGAAQVARLARHIADTGANARITVFGTLEEPAPASVVSQAGTYSVEALPTLCAEQGVNAFWFPSIWPETFSFVVHEMKAMGLPVLAYDVGAQADTLADDDRHRVVSLDMSVDDILITLTEMTTVTEMRSAS